MVTEDSAERWAAHPVAARLIRAAVALLPIAGSIVFVHFASMAIQMPTNSFVLFVSWWVAMSGTATVVLIGLDRISRKLLPLVALLNLSLVFPDQAPSRFRAALRSNTAETLEQRLERARTLNDDSTPVEAAEQLLALVADLNVHDPTTRGHSERVRAYAQMIGKELHLKRAELDSLNWAALLHDVGKLKVPGEILNKAGNPTDEEWAMLRRHTRFGEELVAPLREWLGEWSDAVGQHHERWDGLGYPDNLSGEDISLAARIVAVADVFDVITSTRSYKPSFAAATARDEIAHRAGAFFDPRVVRAFLNISLGRLRLVMGPLSWLAHTPILFRLPLTPTIGTMALSMATVAGALTTGMLSTTTAPGHASNAPPPARARIAAVSIAETIRENESAVVAVEQAQGGAAVTSLRIVAQPAAGTVRVTADHRLLYSPPPGFSGEVTIRYEACWAGRGCGRGVVTITVLPVNHPPVARNDSATTTSGVPVSIGVLANDSDPDGDPLFIVSVSDPGAGRTQVLQRIVLPTAVDAAADRAKIVGRRILWSPPAGFAGTTSFRYTVTDGRGGRASGLVMIRVPVPPPTPASPPVEQPQPEAAGSDPAPARTPTPTPTPAPTPAPSATAGPPPRAYPDVASVPEGQTVLVDVLANDTVAAGESLSLASVGIPARGVARKTGGKVEFTAPADYVGPVTIPYAVVDSRGARANSAVSVTVLLVNRPPSFAPGPDQSVPEDAGPQSVSGWASAISPGAGSEAGQAVSFLVAFDNPSLFSEPPRIDPTGALAYTPAANAHGSATVTVRAQDDGGTANGGSDTSASHAFTITVTSVNDSPVANSDVVSVTEDDPVGVTFSVLANDTDIDSGDNLVVSCHTGATVAGGTLTENGGGSFTYVPDSDFVGSETFTYTASDGNGGTSTAVVTLVVAPQPDAPDAADDAYTTPEATELAPAAPGVLGNDGDADGDTLTVQTTPVTPPAHGTLVLSSDGSFTYAPEDGFSGTDSFEYRSDDGTGLTDDAVATITVDSTTTLSSLYFTDAGFLGTIWAMTANLPAPASPVPDYDADGSPGLSIEKSDGKESNTDPTVLKAWAYTTSAPLVLNGPVTLTLWSTIADFAAKKAGHPHVYLYDCDVGGSQCDKIAENDVHVREWNGTVTTWMSRTITVGSVDRTIATGRVLKVVVFFSHADLWLAMTAAYPSGLTLSLDSV